MGRGLETFSLVGGGRHCMSLETAHASLFDDSIAYFSHYMPSFRCGEGSGQRGAETGLQRGDRPHTHTHTPEHARGIFGQQVRVCGLFSLYLPGQFGPRKKSINHHPLNNPPLCLKKKPSARLLFPFPFSPAPEQENEYEIPKCPQSIFSTAGYCCTSSLSPKKEGRGGRRDRPLWTPDFSAPKSPNRNR